LTEHTLESVIKASPLDECLCITELRLECVGIAAVKVVLDVVEVNCWDGG
jgi:hypothetical protein